MGYSTIYIGKLKDKFNIILKQASLLHIQKVPAIEAGSKKQFYSTETKRLSVRQLSGPAVRGTRPPPHLNQLHLRIAQGGKAAAIHAALVDIDCAVDYFWFLRHRMPIYHKRTAAVFRRPVQPLGPAVFIDRSCCFAI